MKLFPVLMPIPQVNKPRSPEQTRQQRETARRALTESAKLCGAPQGGWEQDATGAPLVNRGFHWSITHKRLWAAGVVSTSPVGIDIEHIAPRGRELHDRLATEKEWALLGQRSWETFFRMWTAKESTLKSHGVGIAGLLQCQLTAVLNDTHLQMDYQGVAHHVEHFFYEDHAVAVASEVKDIEWIVRA